MRIKQTSSAIQSYVPFQYINSCNEWSVLVNRNKQALTGKELREFGWIYFATQDTINCNNAYQGQDAYRKGDWNWYWTDWQGRTNQGESWGEGRNSTTSAATYLQRKADERWEDGGWVQGYGWISSSSSSCFEGWQHLRPAWVWSVSWRGGADCMKGWGGLRSGLISVRNCRMVLPCGDTFRHLVCKWQIMSEKCSKFALTDTLEYFVL